MIALGMVASYQYGRARADGIPSMPTMYYGISLDENDAPVTGSRDVRVRFFDTEMGGSALCETTANATPFSQGNARIALAETCRTVVQQNATLWVELAVGGVPVGGRSRIGAVPYAVESQRANDLTPAAQQRLLGEADCPRGYSLASGFTGITVCRRALAAGSFDEVVRVGRGNSAFWIDRYESDVTSQSDGGGAQLFTSDDSFGGLPRNGQWTGTTPLAYAHSRTGRPPARSITWFQANEACRASGKRLPTGDEWLTAARGSPDPGNNVGTIGGNSQCHTAPGASPEIRATGLGTSCASAWGAQDLVGNLSEWTAEWFSGVGAVGGAAGEVNFNVANWPAEYGMDGTINLNGSVRRTTPNGPSDLVVGLPAAVSRGGSFTLGTSSGVFNLAANLAPTVWNSTVGFRCIVPR